jgi:hypothetical protein
VNWRKYAWRALAVTGWGMGALSLGWGIYIQTYYIQTAPTHPIPQAGRVFPLTVHLQTVYLTKQENDRANGPWRLTLVAGIGLFAASIVCRERWKEGKEDLVRC